MSWFRNKSLSLARQLSRTLDPLYDYEPQACYNSFCKHWQQAHEVILKSKPFHLHDDVLSVVNHLEHLSTLLVLEAKAREIYTVNTPAPCFEYLLSQNLLDKLYEWAVCTGKYENAVRLEQLKLFSNLISHYSTQVVAAEPFLRPFLKLLSGFRNELPPPNLENQLITVLNQLCIALMQNIKLLDLFFVTTHTPQGSQSEFLPIRLLLAAVHRSGRTGEGARDALLLCAHMAARAPQLAAYMLEGNTCPVLATGLSGLYSLLPRTLSDKIYRLTPDDVNNVHKLTLFIVSLEFCNAVAQVTHPDIKKHLLDLLYQGFLVPVLGPALLQNGAAEQAAAMAYLELILRCVTWKGLLRTVLHFLFVYEYDGVRVIDVLLRRLEGNSQLSLVSLALMETLIDLNCEDVMVELVFKHLLNGHHLMAAYRHKIADPDAYRDAAVSFLGLSPLCCSRPMGTTKQWIEALGLYYMKNINHGEHNGENVDKLVKDLIDNYTSPNVTQIGNYHAYISESRYEIVSRVLACNKWTWKYDSVIHAKCETNNNTKETKEIEGVKEDSLKEPHSLTSLNEQDEVKNESQTDVQTEGKEHDSLTSTGESSGYESFKYKDVEGDEGFAEDIFRRSLLKREITEYDGEVPVIRSWRASAESVIGPLLSSLLKKIATFLESDVIVNCRVTSVLSKLSSLPTPLFTSLLLCPSFVLQPNVPSLFQILSKLKEEVDELTEGIENVGQFVDKARVFLIQREMFLVSRGQSNDDSWYRYPDFGNGSPGQHDSDESPFRRVESKRRSLSNTLSNMFSRRLTSSSPSSHKNHSPQSTSHASQQKRPLFTEEAFWEQSITLRSVLNAVILDEWLKELAALCEEHALRLSAGNCGRDRYVKALIL